MFHLPYGLCDCTDSTDCCSFNVWCRTDCEKHPSVLCCFDCDFLRDYFCLWSCKEMAVISFRYSAHYAPRGIVYPIWKSLTCLQFSDFLTVGYIWCCHAKLKTEKTATKQRSGFIINAGTLLLLTPLCPLPGLRRRRHR